MKLSKRTLALAAALVLTLTSGGILGTRASLQIFSEDYIGDFELDHLQVHLIENDVDVCHNNNDDDTVHGTYTGKEKYHGNLVEYLGYKNDTHYGDTAAYKLGTPGTVEPGRTYKEEIKARNGRDIDQYVRLSIKKYWVDPAGNKATYLSPDLIKLTYNGKAYNTGAWQRNDKENKGSHEMETYYLTNILKGQKKAPADSPLLFNELTIDKEIVSEEHMDRQETTQGNKTVYTYTYDYDGYTFYIEADVQAIQTHNINDAIDSLWGVDNVSASKGRITVK